MRTYSMLLVDDEVENLALLKRIFRKGFSITMASNGEEALKHIKQSSVDIIVTDQRMPNMSGVDLLEQAREFCPDAVRIIISGYTDLEDMIGAINRGEAHRYITKPISPDELKIIIRQAMERYELTVQNKLLNEQIVEQNEELRQKKAELEQINQTLEKRVRERTCELGQTNERLQHALEKVERLARTDSLTGVSNRWYSLEQISRAIAQARRYERKVTVLLIDVDHFKEINDSYGHAIGDNVLVRITEIISGMVREIDIVGRLGGDEFVLCLNELDIAMVEAVAQRLLEKIRSASWSMIGIEESKAVTISIGAALFPDHGDKMEELIEASDTAMYAAKRNGRDRFQLAKNVESS